MSARTMKSDGRILFGALCVAAGLTYLVIGLARHMVGFGIAGLAIMLAYGGVLFALRGRSESAQLLSGKPGDERQAQVMLKASAATGQLLVTVLVISLVVSMAAGSSHTGVIAWLCAAGGACFIATTVWYSRRG
jgi:hypothetical protein